MSSSCIVKKESVTCLMRREEVVKCSGGTVPRGTNFNFSFIHLLLFILGYSFRDMHYSEVKD